MRSDERVAIVGLAGLFPGAGSLEEFWHNASEGIDASRDVPSCRWCIPPERAFDPRPGTPDRVYCTRGYFLEPFEPDLTGLEIDPHLVSQLDVLYQLALHVGNQAFRQAKMATVARSRIGVILGSIALPTDRISDWAREVLLSEGREVATHPWNQFVTGLPAALLAHSLGLGGTAYTLDAACASSLYAIKLAADELLSGRADAILAGGLSRPDCLYTQMGFSQLRALSASGRCSPFDVGADGLVVGEGAGIFVLKRLGDAIVHGDCIHGVITGVGLSNDIEGNLLAPATEGQLRAMRSAYRSAGWQPHDVDLIECHATGTPVGDQVEFQSLMSLWDESPQRPGVCVVGTVKSTVGHLLTGANAAGLMKVLLALRHARLPGMANFRQAAAGVSFDQSPFRILNRSVGWPRRGENIPRRAAISGFGFGGINAHLLIEEWLGPEADRTVSPRIGPQTPIAIVSAAAHFGNCEGLDAFAARALGLDSPKAGTPDDFKADSITVPLGAFPIPPKEMEEMLPQQLLILLAADQALQGQSAVAGERAGVVVGVDLDRNTTNFHMRWWAGEFLDESAKDAANPPLTANRTMGALASIAASRIARAFRFGGPSFTISSGETSGLHALEVAVSLLQRGEIDRALVGAVDLAADPRAAQGDGAVVLVVKRLADAQRDGDRVIALLGESAEKVAGGPSFSLSPALRGEGRGEGRERCSISDVAGLTQAFPLTPTGVPQSRGESERGLRPLSQQSPESGSENYPESGSEFQFFDSGLQTSDSRHPSWRVLPIASAIGDCGAATGLAAVLRAALALSANILPTRVDSTTGAQAKPQFWLHDSSNGVRSALIDIPGLLGRSTRIVLCEAPSLNAVKHFLPAFAQGEPSFPLSPPLQVEGEGLGKCDTSHDFPRPFPSPRPESRNAGDREEEGRVDAPTFRARRDIALFLAAGQTRAELRERLSRLEHLASSDSAQSIDALAGDWWKQERGNHGPYRASFAVRDVEELRASIRDSFTSPEERAAAPRGKIAFVYPGSGNHFSDMGRQLGLHFPEILRQQQSENSLLRSQYAADNFWTGPQRDEAHPREILFAQVSCCTLISDIVRSFGIEPDAVIGYSLGESASLFGMRIWRERDVMLQRLRRSTLFSSDLAAPFNSARSRWGWDRDRPIDWVTGVVALPAAAVRQALDPNHKAYVLIVNTPNECVVGGQRPHVAALVKRLQTSLWEVRGVTTAHCEAALPVKDAYRALHHLAVSELPGVRFFSGAWGKPYEVDSDNAADAILAAVLDIIDFPRVIESAYANGARIFIEIGPGSSCCRMIDGILQEQPHIARPTHVRHQDALATLLELLAKLHVQGVDLELAPLYGHEQKQVRPNRREIRLPAHPPLPRLSQVNDSSPAEYVDRSSVEQASELSEQIAQGGSFRTSGSCSNTSEACPTEAGPTPVFVVAADSLASTAAAHEAFLRFSAGTQARLAETIARQTELLQQWVGQAPSREFEQIAAIPPVPIESRAPDSSPAAVPRSLNYEQCREFAAGKIGNVLGPLFAEADAFPTRVRLPDGPLMLVDRILEIEGEPLSLTSGRVVTEHGVDAERWYLDAGRIPTCVAVEAGQADLFLSGFLGIDRQTRGLAVYRLLDAVVTFHGPLPGIGELIHYDIHIDRFFRQGDTHLFRFRFESTVDGKPLLSMTDGCAGFFSAQELSSGKGIVHTELDRRRIPGKRPADWRPLVEIRRESFDSEQIDALRQGDLVRAFGDEFRGLAVESPLRLPSGMLRLVDRVVDLVPDGGRFGLGVIRAEADIHQDDWFLTCHFVDDMVMPGTLMYECCLHTLRIFLMRMGWIGEEGKVVCEPVPGIASKLKCRGQVIASTKTAAYEVAIKEIGFGPEPFAIADALMFADGKPIVEITNMSLRLSGLDRARLESIWSRRPAESKHDAVSDRKVLFDTDRILAFAIGKPSEAFGPPYRIFDNERVIARLPGPPYQFLDRITQIDAEPWKMVGGGTVVAEYDVPADAWYFAAQRAPSMSFSILLEVALQPCGWLAAFIGSALTSDIDLSFRNLGGSAIQHRPVGPDAGTLTTTVKITRVSSSGGMIIQHYDYTVRNRGQEVYSGDTYFGFFSKQALANQVGLRELTLYCPDEHERHRAWSGLYPRELPFPDTQLRMVNTIAYNIPEAGSHRLGFVEGRIAVDPKAWFFKAHFYQDPVWPGSLGLESFLQVLRFFAVRRWNIAANQPAAPALGTKHQWTYRGQVLPVDKEVTVQAQITSADDERHTLTADGLLSVDGRIIYKMTGFTLKAL